MFVQTGDFVEHAGMLANNAMTFYGQEKVEYNAQLCLMNLAVHGLTGVVKSGDEANTFYHDAHNLVGCCDYVMAINWSKKVIKFKSTLNKNHICKNNIFLFNPLASDHLGFAVAARSKYNLTLLPQQSQDTMIRQVLSSRKRLRRM